MSDIATISLVVTVVVGILLSALCSGIETGIYSINRVRLALGVGRGERRALMLREEMDHPNRLLAALLIANTIANDLVAIGTSRLLDGIGLGPIGAVAINTLILVPMLFVLGEVIPKDLFRRIADRATIAMAPSIRAGRLILTWCGLVPLVQAVSNAALRRLGAQSEQPLSSRQRLARLFEEGAGAGVLTEAQVTLAERVMGVTGRTVAERLVPWRRVQVVRDGMDAGARLQLLRSRGFSRYPVVDAEGRVVGVASALDLLLHPARSVRQLAVAACWVRPETSLLDALEAMRRARAKLAIVGEPAATPVGVVSLTDLVEPLVGTFDGDL